jgi:hypothetical protein
MSTPKQAAAPTGKQADNHVAIVTDNRRIT